MHKPAVNDEKRVLAARFRLDEAFDVEMIAAEQGLTVSDFLRKAVRNEIEMIRRYKEDRGL